LATKKLIRATTKAAPKRTTHRVVSHRDAALEPIAARLLQWLAGAEEAPPHRRRRAVFGVPGSSLAPILKELLTSDSFQFVMGRHEAGSAYMADGYARVSGRLGVVFTTSGPGATNAFTGALNARCAGVPLLTVTGDVDQKALGLGDLQEGLDASFNVNDLFRSASIPSYVATNKDNCENLFRRAIADALTSHSRGAHICIPTDVLTEKVLERDTTPLWRVGAARTRARGLGGSDALDVLCRAKLPLILPGNGSRAALRCDRQPSAPNRPARNQACVCALNPGGKGRLVQDHDDNGAAVHFAQVFACLGLPCPILADEHGVAPGACLTHVERIGHGHRFLSIDERPPQATFESVLFLGFRGHLVTVSLVLDPGDLLGALDHPAARVQDEGGVVIGESGAGCRSVRSSDHPLKCSVPVVSVM